MLYSQVYNKAKYFITRLPENDFVIITEEDKFNKLAKGFAYNIKHEFIEPVIFQFDDLQEKLLKMSSYYRIAQKILTAKDGLRYR